MVAGSAIWAGNHKTIAPGPSPPRFQEGKGGKGFQDGPRAGKCFAPRTAPRAILSEQCFVCMPHAG